MIILQLDSSELSDVVKQAVSKALQEVQFPEQKTQEQDQLLTVEQCAEFLNLSKATIYGLISKGELPVMKRSKRCYFSRLELVQYLKEGKRNSNSETNSEAESYLKK